jgi:uncharacterized protein (DUF2141 family)
MVNLILSLLFLVVTPAEFKQAPILEVSIQQAKSDKGKIRVLVFSKETGFPDELGQAIKSYSISPKDKSCKIRIEDLPAGTYAISVIHDEDENGSLTTNLVGYPVEKFGFSNNPKVYFAPPTFDKAAFELRGESKQIRIDLR